ncbi:hypothetical protein C0J50_11223 [Silurus asotus]|uniref:Reverse transcriptase domain-containing protein n=1 Tax=Silurus asotus TaxID=30991 RepID=A0AAD5AC00_SILAS|nr:hypothetical protein C0J50_11223 [Silurus asotus]
MLTNSRLRSTSNLLTPDTFGKEYRLSLTATSSASLPNKLNLFYARFEKRNIEPLLKTEPLPGEQPLTLSTSKVCVKLERVNARKAVGPDGILGCVLGACAEQLIEVFTDIFNLSLAQAIVPTCIKSATIVPVPKHSTATELADFHPVALTPVIAKCFERLVLTHLKACLPPSLNPYQFAYCTKRSTEDAISTVLHSALTHV